MRHTAYVYVRRFFVIVHVSSDAQAPGTGIMLNTMHGFRMYKCIYIIAYIGVLFIATSPQCAQR